MSLDQSVEESESKRIIINVGGTKFETYPQTLIVGSTYFKNLLNKNWNDNKHEIFIDRDPQLFTYVLRYLRDFQASIPWSVVDTEFLYFGIDIPENVNIIKIPEAKNTLLELTDPESLDRHKSNNANNSAGGLIQLIANDGKYDEHLKLLLANPYLDNRDIIINPEISSTRDIRMFQLQTHDNTSKAIIPLGLDYHTYLKIRFLTQNKSVWNIFDTITISYEGHHESTLTYTSMCLRMISIINVDIHSDPRVVNSIKMINLPLWFNPVQYKSKVLNYRKSKKELSRALCHSQSYNNISITYKNESICDTELSIFGYYTGMIAREKIMNIYDGESKHSDSDQDITKSPNFIYDSWRENSFDIPENSLSFQVQLVSRLGVINILFGIFNPELDDFIDKIDGIELTSHGIVMKKYSMDEIKYEMYESYNQIINAVYVLTFLPSYFNFNRAPDTFLTITLKENVPNNNCKLYVQLQQLNILRYNGTQFLPLA